MKITIYTDGSSRGNPGPGGWAAILMVDRQQTTDNRECENTDEVIELGGSEKLTTNNRMELMGALRGLAEIGDSRQQRREKTIQNSGDLSSDICHLTSVEVCTDSQYVKKGMTEWIDGWIKKGWKGSTKKPVLNQDLWEALKKEEDRLKALGTKVTWTYVPGHAGVTMNERADVIATACADSVMDGGASNLQLYRGPKSEYLIDIR